MKTWKASILSLGLAGGLLTGVAGFSAIFSSPAPAHAGAVKLEDDPDDKREPHAVLREALESLRNARHKLEHANHDFDGHRAEALSRTDEAIAQCEAALAADRH